MEFGSFYEQTVHRSYGFALGLTGDAAEAQDLVQEAYARAWERWRVVRSADSPAAWVATVIRRLSANRWRHLAVMRRHTPTLAQERQETTIDTELPIDLLWALQQLNSDERSAVVLHYVAAYTAVEVAEILGRPVGTVKALTYRARKKLAVLLADYQAPRTCTGVKEG